MIYEVREDVTFARRWRSSSSRLALERNHLSAEIRIPRCDSLLPRERSFVLSFFPPFRSFPSSLLERESRVRRQFGRDEAAYRAESELDSPQGESIYRGSVSCLGRRRCAGSSRIFADSAVPLCPGPTTRVGFPQLAAIVSIFPRARLSHGRNTGKRKGKRGTAGEKGKGRGTGTKTGFREHDSGDSFHINNGGSSITSGGGNGRYAETEKGAR